MPIVLPDGFGLGTVTIDIAGGAGPAINVWGLDNNSATAQENAEALRDGYENTLMDAMTVSAVLRGTKVIQNDGGTYTVGESASTQAGTVSAASAPPAVSVIAKKITSAPGRAGRGRVYFPGVDETQVDSGGNLTTSYAADWQTAIDAFLTGYTGGLLVILHRDPLDPSDYTFATPTPILTILVESHVATQRRRNR